jgi:succinate dehydrogenase/fumarate reductase flavoprotein subunit
MCTVLVREVRRREIPVHENRVVVSLLSIGEGEEKRIVGAIALNLERDLSTIVDWQTAFEVYAVENMIFATGGPGGLYKTSVYPRAHTGGIGLALMVGAKAQSLPESQFGLGSITLPWNTSGSYMQVIPRFFSTGPDRRGDAREFLRPYFDSVDEMNSTVFLKGYQWPFDARKVASGSSLVDVLVSIETILKKRHVFLDYRRNSDGFRFEALSPEARGYLAQSGAIADTPIERLKLMNPAAVDHYRERGIDLTAEPLETAVCAQHNNGGLAANMWWESSNIKHLFTVGEVNGSHGVDRPGGSALNSGQVGGFRAAEYIANRYRGSSLDMDQFRSMVRRVVADLWGWIGKGERSSLTWEKEREEFQMRMTRVGSHVRSLPELRKGVSDAWRQWNRLREEGCRSNNLTDLSEGLRNLQLCFAHAAYLEAILFAVESGVGSRGSAIVLDEKGVLPHKNLGGTWRFAPENRAFRERVLETIVEPNGQVENHWVDRRPLPHTEAWFETEWKAFREGEIYRSD